MIGDVPHALDLLAHLLADQVAGADIGHLHARRVRLDGRGIESDHDDALALGAPHGSRESGGVHRLKHDGLALLVDEIVHHRNLGLGAELRIQGLDCDIGVLREDSHHTRLPGVGVRLADAGRKIADFECRA